MDMRAFGVVAARGDRRLRYSAAAIGIASLLVLVGCSPQPTPETTDGSDSENAYACGELAALSATVLRLGGDASDSDARAVIDAVSEGLQSLTVTGTGRIEEAFRNAQKQAVPGMSVDDFVNVVEDAVLACGAAGLTIEYRMPGG
ncbi:hypothetical protein [Agromyces sp. NPDC058126]|uniref:hypothetical protein n=1 Tax=Agromyces sp. NPDC058126 TaxID=3346350 RepID=UPI0036DCB241